MSCTVWYVDSAGYLSVFVRTFATCVWSRIAQTVNIKPRSDRSVQLFDCQHQMTTAPRQINMPFPGQENVTPMTINPILILATHHDHYVVIATTHDLCLRSVDHISPFCPAESQTALQNAIFRLFVVRFLSLSFLLVYFNTSRILNQMTTKWACALSAST